MPPKKNPKIFIPNQLENSQFFKTSVKMSRYYPAEGGHQGQSVPRGCVTHKCHPGFGMAVACHPSSRRDAQMTFKSMIDDDPGVVCRRLGLPLISIFCQRILHFPPFFPRRAASAPAGHNSTVNRRQECLRAQSLSQKGHIFNWKILVHSSEILRKLGSAPWDCRELFARTQG